MICFASAGFNAGWAGITASPQTPVPPCTTFCVKWAIEALLFGYFLATSVNAGPIDFSFILWQVLQFLP